MSSGILKLARLNPSFAKLLGCIYVLLGVGMLGALNAGEGSLCRAPVAGREGVGEHLSGQSIADYKNLLRMRLHSDGRLTVYPLGVDRVGHDWRHVGRNGAEPKFAPGGAPPTVCPIDAPLHYDVKGRRVT